MKDVTPNRSGAGSTYGGTQSPDPDAPDGYQKPEAKDSGITGKEETRPEAGLGKEYEEGDSYGSKGADATKNDTTGESKKNDSMQEGSHTR